MIAVVGGAVYVTIDGGIIPEEHDSPPKDGGECEVCGVVDMDNHHTTIYS